jgi:formylglycine-generating enzyme required for sulfatase activity
MPTGQREANAFGLQDMLGNAAEWVDDWYDPGAYQHKQLDSAGQVEPEEKVFRGGSSLDGPASLRVSRRRSLSPNQATIYIGFRCVQVQKLAK